MLQHPKSYDPFTTNGLLDFPELEVERSGPWQPFKPGKDLENEIFRLAEVKLDPLQDFEANLFQLGLQDVPLPDLDSSISSGTDSDHEDVVEHKKSHDVVDELHDIWTLPDVAQPPKDNKLLSWDTFVNQDHIEPVSSNLSEHGPAVFNAILSISLETRNNTKSITIKPDVFLSSLFELSMGRESLLFYFDETKVTFVSAEDCSMAFGYTAESTETITKLFIRTGNQIRRLMGLISNIQNWNTSNSAVHAAFASCISSTLYAIQQYLGTSARRPQSLLRLQAYVERPSILVDLLCEMLSIVENDTRRGSVIEHLSTLIQSTNKSYPWTEDCLHEILSRTLAPVIRILDNWTSLESTTTSTSNTDTLQQAAEDPFRVLSLAADAALPLDIKRLVDETRHSLDLLAGHAAEHPVLQAGLRKSSSTCELAYSWDAIHQLQYQAKEYESQLRGAVLGLRMDVMSPVHQDVHTSPDNVSDPFDVETVFAMPLECETSLGHRSRGLEDGTGDLIFDHVLTILDDDGRVKEKSYLQPATMEAFSLSLAPILTARHRLLSYSIFHLLFKKLHLRDHLDMQIRFHLFGDGTFSSRLSQALFDSSQASGEGGRAAGISTGLRLQSRDNWPPASSELRLVLMGILSESITSRDGKADTATLESISFAIRDLSEEELERCRDVNSVHALDFLRLHYRPPNPLMEAIITPSSLRKYDRIFRHLLQALRVQSVAKHMLRDVSNRHVWARPTKTSHGLRIDIQHFVSTLADYSQNIAIGLPWRKLELALTEIDRSLDRQDYERTLALAHGLEHLRQLHEEALDEMTRSLFLNKRQAEVKTLIENVYGIVLQFAASDNNEEVNEHTTTRLHEDFRKAAGKFVRYLKGQCDFGTNMSGSGTKEVLPLEQLLMRLDFNGHWSKYR